MSGQQVADVAKLEFYMLRKHSECNLPSPGDVHNLGHAWGLGVIQGLQCQWRAWRVFACVEVAYKKEVLPNCRHQDETRAAAEWAGLPLMQDRALASQVRQPVLPFHVLVHTSAEVAAIHMTVC